MDTSCNGAKMYLVIFVFVICVILRSTRYIVLGVLKVSPDVVDIRVFCCLFVVCVYICSAGYLCRATYCSVVSTLMLGVSHAIQNKKKLYKFTQSDSVYLLYKYLL